MRVKYIAILLLAGVFACKKKAEVAAEHQHAEKQQEKSENKSASPAAPDRATVTLSAEEQRKSGLQTTLFTRKNVKTTISANGVIATDERRETAVYSRVSGYIEQIIVDFTGKEISRGQHLFKIYSPEIVSAQEEYLAALEQGGEGEAGELAAVARERLRLWGVSNHELKQIANEKKAHRVVYFCSPQSGFVLSKSAVQGLYINPQTELYRIANLSNLWVIISLYEMEFSQVRVGDKVTIRSAYADGLELTGRITYLYPDIDAQTRTGRARIEFKNRKNSFKPGMYVKAEISRNLGEAGIVSDDSIIDTGSRKLVFVRKDPTTFEPREIILGQRVSGGYTVKSGLTEGEEIVTGANFLLDAESKMRAITGAGGKTPGHGSH